MSQATSTVFSAALGILLLVACGDSSSKPEADASMDAGCGSDSDCDDGLFCNGAEVCDDGRCVTGTAPCDGECDESSARCESTCVNPDKDGDGSAAPECGGDDCDDEDPARFPGNVETCDPLGRDEDCDPATLGDDGDGDGWPSNDCCNEDPREGLVCGADCDDARSGVNPGAREICNHLDDDCDGAVDEGVLVEFYRDVDGDGFGIVGDVTMDCSAPAGYATLSGDCNDALPGVNPGVGDGPTSACDGVDNDCDETVDEGCDCIEGTMRGCGPVDSEGAPLTEGLCEQGTQSCGGGTWGDCIGDVAPDVEACTGEDEDCDGAVDEGLRVSCYVDADDDSYALASATEMQICRDPSRTDRGECPEGYTNRVPSSSTADCNDGNPDQNPGLTEVCANGIDDNCAGGIDESCTCGGCACEGVSTYAPTAELEVTDREGYVDYAGYRFGWHPPDAMGRAVVSIACASSGKMYEAAYAMESSFGAPLVIGENVHEMYLRSISVGGTGTTFEVWIIRL